MEKICDSDEWWNNDKCLCEYKKHHVCEKYYNLNLQFHNTINELREVLH